MKQIKLKLFEVYELNSELKGIINTSTGEKLSKGLLDEKLSITTKYWLTDLNDKLEKEINSVDKIKEDLIKKLGTADDQGNISLAMRINEVFDKDNNIVSYDYNPAFVEYQTEFNKLLQEEVEISYREFKLEDIDIETEVNPKILFKLIQVTE